MPTNIALISLAVTLLPVFQAKSTPKAQSSQTTQERETKSRLRDVEFAPVSQLDTPAGSPTMERVTVARGKASIRLPAAWEMEIEDSHTYLFAPDARISPNALRITVFTMPSEKGKQTAQSALEQLPGCKGLKTVALPGGHYLRRKSALFVEGKTRGRTDAWWMTRTVDRSTIRLVLVTFSMAEARYSSQQTKTERKFVEREVKLLRLQ